MRRQIRLKIRYNRRTDLAALLALALLLPALLCVLAWGQPGAASSQSSSQVAPGENQPAAPSDVSYRPLRDYYLTIGPTLYSGTQAKNACSSGYHMASLWEIFDPSAMRYNLSGDTRVDSGKGPPSDDGGSSKGFVRTGYLSDNSANEGQANCNAWGSTSGYGSITSLPSDWNVTNFDLGPWSAGTSSCYTGTQVWCVGDQSSGGPYAPLRQYYVTKDSTFDGNEADNASNCALGYHFASLWEIFDPSALRYNPNLGATSGDRGSGPPSSKRGWVRTGSYYSYESTQGKGNCNAWGSNSISHWGSGVALQADWEDYALGPWQIFSSTCDNEFSAWCVADALDGEGSCSAPLSISCGQTVSGDTTGKASHLDDYDCSPYTLDENGPEDNYQLNLPAVNASYNISVTISHMTADLDVFMLGGDGCRTGSCADTDTYGNTYFTKTGLPSGGFFIAVDGYNGVADSYSLEVECNYMATFLPLVTKP